MGVCGLVEKTDIKPVSIRFPYAYKLYYQRKIIGSNGKE